VNKITYERQIEPIKLNIRIRSVFASLTETSTKCIKVLLTDGVD